MIQALRNWYLVHGFPLAAANVEYIMLMRSSSGLKPETLLKDLSNHAKRKSRRKPQ